MGPIIVTGAVTFLLSFFGVLEIQELMAKQFERIRKQDY